MTRIKIEPSHRNPFLGADQGDLQTAVVRTDTPNLSYTICGSQIRLSEPLRASCALCCGHTNSPNFYMLSTRFQLVKTGFPIFYKPHTHSAVIKTGSPNSQRSPTRFLEVKTGSANVYKPCTRFAAVKADSPNF